jgi:hypothetical protein
VIADTSRTCKHNPLLGNRENGRKCLLTKVPPLAHVALGLSSTQQKERANYAPSYCQGTGTQWVVANAALWNVEYFASKFFTTGIPSMNRAMIFSICGYSSRL